MALADRSLILLREAGGRARYPDQKVAVEAAAMSAARAAGVPVAEIYDYGAGALGQGYLLMERLDGETIPVLLRDEAVRRRAAGPRAPPREVLAPDQQRGSRFGPRPAPGRRARPGDRASDEASPSPGRQLSSVCAGSPGTALLLPRTRWSTATSGPAISWSARTGCTACSTGNSFIAVTPGRTWGGCAPRPGGSPGEPPSAGSVPVRIRWRPRRPAAHPPDEETQRWWELYGTVRWALLCRRQAERYLAGDEPSIELAVLGRRVCEQEYDILLALGHAAPLTVTDPLDNLGTDPAPPHDRPPSPRPAPRRPRVPYRRRSVLPISG